MTMNVYCYCLPNVFSAVFDLIDFALVGRLLWKDCLLSQYTVVQAQIFQSSFRHHTFTIERYGFRTVICIHCHLKHNGDSNHDRCNIFCTFPTHGFSPKLSTVRNAFNASILASHIWSIACSSVSVDRLGRQNNKSYAQVIKGY